MANDFLPFGTGAGANVLDQADYAVLGARTAGFSAGTAKSIELNKVWRQSAFISSVLAQFIADTTGEDVLDDGDAPTLQENLVAAIAGVPTVGLTAITGLTNTNVTLTATQYAKPIITLAGTLTGNIQIIFPATQQQWLVINGTTGAFTVTCKTASGTGVAVDQGGGAEIYGDGVNIALPAFQVGAATKAEHAMQLGQATGRLLGVQIFTSNGTYTPGTYNGVTATMVRKRICGGGGGGGGAPTTTSSQVAVANGGNGGAYVEWIGPAASETVTIGAGGTAGTAGPNAGGAGGTTSAGSITAVGGFGGTTGGATTPPYINPGQANNGGGALGPSGGGNITVSRGCSLGGYGLSVGLAGVIGGQGGDSAFSPSYKSASIPSSTSYGAGGGGAANGPSASAAAGTIGRPGVVIYEEYA